MSDATKPEVGTIAWRDLTVKDAGGIRDFYESVVGWRAKGLDMGGYEDFVMMPPTSDEGIAGICHAQGVNADLPPVWLLYITVADIDQSVSRCVELGGKVLVSPRDLGTGHFCVIEDPAGAICALYQPTE